jgi:hypothetical protein
MFPKKNVQTNTSISPVVQSFLIGMKLVDREKVHLLFFSLKNSPCETPECLGLGFFLLGLGISGCTPDVRLVLGGKNHLLSWL